MPGSKVISCASVVRKKKVYANKRRSKYQHNIINGPCKCGTIKNVICWRCESGKLAVANCQVQWDSD